MKRIFVIMLCFVLCISLISCNAVNEIETLAPQSSPNNTDEKNETNKDKVTEQTKVDPENDPRSLAYLTKINFSTGRKTRRVAPEVKDGKLQIPLEGISYVHCFREVYRVLETGIDTFYRNQETIAKMINYFNSLDIPDEPSDEVYSLMTGTGSINAIIFYENDDVILITLSGACIAFNNDSNYLYSGRTWYMVGQAYHYFGENILGIDP